MDKNFELLAVANACYQALSKFRLDRDRNKRYHYGDQWGDLINVDGRLITERQFIEQEGSVPLTNNLIRRLVRNVIGVFQSMRSEPKCMSRNLDEQQAAEAMTTLLRCNADLNRLELMHIRSLEEFLISGLVVHRKWYGTRNGITDCWTDYVQPNNFFVDCNMRDFRSWDCSCIGEIHDISMQELLMKFAKSPTDYKTLRAIYGHAADSDALSQAWQDFGYSAQYMQSFLAPANPGLCRVIEVWRKETREVYHCHDTLTGEAYVIDATDYHSLVEKVNTTRKRKGVARLVKATWEMVQGWRYYFLSPFGDVLLQGNSPYAHGSHPYVVKGYPMIDGEIHSFVADVIDQQRYTNRLITMYDWIARSSAKGVLMVPEESIPRGCTLDDFAQMWSRHNGVLVYRSTANGDMPRQVMGNLSNLGISELLNMQLKFFEDISGVNGALQGRLSNSAMSAELYSQQTQNATTTLLDVLTTYAEFMREAANKDICNMQQFYSPEKIKSIIGNSSTDCSQIRQAEFCLTVASTSAVSANRQASNQMLMEMCKNGQITLQEMLKAGDFPFAESFLANHQSAL